MKASAFFVAVVVVAAVVIDAAPSKHFDTQLVLRDFPNDVDAYGWTDYLEQIASKITEVVDRVKQTGGDLWEGLKEAGEKIISKAKCSMISPQQAADAFLKDVYPTLVAKISSTVDFTKQELEFLGDLVVTFLREFGSEAVRLGIKYFEEHQDEIVEEIKSEAKIFLRAYVLKKLKDLWVSGVSKRDIAPMNGWTDFWEKVGKSISSAVDSVKQTGADLADKISEEFDKIKDRVNDVLAPVKAKVQVILRDVMPAIAAKAKVIFNDAKELAKQVGSATLEILRKLGHDALVEAKKWLENNHELVEDLLFKFLTEQLPKMIQDSMASYSVVEEYNALKDFFGKIGNAINTAIKDVKNFGGRLADKIKEQYNKIAAKVNGIVAPIGEKVRVILQDVMPKFAEKAKEVIHDAKERAKEVGRATLDMIKELGHDALISAKKWIEEHHEEIEHLLFEFLVEVLPKLISSAIRAMSNFWTDFWTKVNKGIEAAVEAVKKTGQKFADAISEQYDKIAAHISAIVTPIKAKVDDLLRNVLPKIAEKAKIVISDAKELAKQVGTALLKILRKLGHDALLEAKIWLENNHELVEKLLFEFLTEELPKYIQKAISQNYSVAKYNGWTDFWGKVGKAIDNAVSKVKATGERLADKIVEEFNKVKDKINGVIAPIKTKVQIILRDVMPVIAAKARVVIRDAKELAKQVGEATLGLLKQLGHDAVIEAQKWLEKNRENVEKLLFEFLTEQLPKLIKDMSSSYVSTYNGWTDFWEKVGNAIENAISDVKEKGKKLADKISEEFDKLKDKINSIIAPVKAKVQIILKEIMPKIAEKAKLIIHDAKELAKQVGEATLELLKKLGHDALVEAKKWLEENHELVEKLLFQFLTEKLPELINQSISSSYLTTYNGWTDFWEKVGKAIDNAVTKVKQSGERFADMISKEFNKFKNKVNEVIAPIKAKVKLIMEDIMPKIAEKAKLIFQDAKELAKQVGEATLVLVKQLGHDALVEAQKWLEKNHEVVEKLLFEFLTEKIPKLIQDLNSSEYSLITYNKWSDFWEKVEKSINTAVSKVKEAGAKLADKISEEFENVKDKVNEIIAPIKTKVRIILQDIMPKIAEKAKLIIHDAKELAKQVGAATLEILKKLGHDALIEAQKWLSENHDLVEKLLFQFLTEQLPNLIQKSITSSYSLTVYGWNDFWEKVGEKIDNAVEKVKQTGRKLADKISEEFDELKDKINAILAPVKTKVNIILSDIMPKIAEKAKLIFKDAKVLAEQVGLATIELLKKLGHDALVEAQKWLVANRDLVENLLFVFLTEQLPKLIGQSLS